MERTAIFVDAGYLTAAGGNLMVGTPDRAKFGIRVGALITKICEIVQSDSELPNLRTYWYDGRRGPELTDEQQQISAVPFVKLRLSRSTNYKRQKGVDALIFRDITMLARERAIATAYLLAGDGDLTEAVAEEQNLGIQVILLSVLNAGNSNVSSDLIDEVDKDITLENEDLQGLFALIPATQP